jgi:hypothetical protein
VFGEDSLPDLLGLLANALLERQIALAGSGRPERPLV